MNKSYKTQLDYIVEALDEMEYALKKQKNAQKDAKFFYYAAQKKAEEIIETAITLNQDILIDRLSHMTKSYYDSFTDLKNLEIMPMATLEKLASTAGFRNRLAHEYTELDPQITISSMFRLLKLYPDYVRAVKEYLAK